VRSSVPCHLLSLSLTRPPSPTHIYTLSLHDALPISSAASRSRSMSSPPPTASSSRPASRSSKVSRTRLPSPAMTSSTSSTNAARSEEHTSELQSPDHLVCRLLLEKQNTITTTDRNIA